MPSGHVFFFFVGGVFLFVCARMNKYSLVIVMIGLLVPGVSCL